MVIGPIVGLGLGALLMWFCLRKRKKQKEQQERESLGQTPQDRFQHYAKGEAPIEKYSHTVKLGAQQWQQHSVVEAPDNTTPAQPAELWHGNYRS